MTERTIGPADEQRTAVERAAQEFNAQRGYLISVAYRLTGSWVDAEDAVSDAWTRWQAAHDEVRDPRAWLTTVVSRIALDQLRSARSRRETYVGPWLPEPVITDTRGAVVVSGSYRSGDDPSDRLVLDEGLRMAILVVLDSLTPPQRVAVVLHDALGLPFTDIAEVLGCSAEAARQCASRGRRRLAGANLPVPDPPAAAGQTLHRLADALRREDAHLVASLLAPDVVMTGDGGGEVTAFRRPLAGAAEVAKFLLALAGYIRDGHVQVDVVGVNGEPGLLMHFDGRRPHDPRIGAYAVTISGGRVQVVRGVLAPGKVSHLPGSPYPRPDRSARPEPGP